MLIHFSLLSGVTTIMSVDASDCVSWCILSAFHDDLNETFPFQRFSFRTPNRARVETRLRAQRLDCDSWRGLFSGYDFIVYMDRMRAGIRSLFVSVISVCSGESVPGLQSEVQPTSVSSSRNASVPSDSTISCFGFFRDRALGLSIDSSQLSLD